MRALSLQVDGDNDSDIQRNQSSVYPLVILRPRNPHLIHVAIEEGGSASLKIEHVSLARYRGNHKPKLLSTPKLLLNVAVCLSVTNSFPSRNMVLVFGLQSWKMVSESFRLSTSEPICFQLLVYLLIYFSPFSFHSFPFYSQHQSLAWPSYVSFKMFRT